MGMEEVSPGVSRHARPGRLPGEPPEDPGRPRIPAWPTTGGWTRTPARPEDPRAGPATNPRTAANLAGCSGSLGGPVHGRRTNTGQWRFSVHNHHDPDGQVSGAESRRGADRATWNPRGLRRGWPAGANRW